MGRTLLTAFLVMAILPLSVVSWYATNRSRTNIQEQVTERLASVSTFKETQIMQWVEEQAAALTGSEYCFYAGGISQDVTLSPSQIRTSLMDRARQCGAEDLALVNEQGQVAWSSDPLWEGEQLPVPDASSPYTAYISIAPGQQDGIVLVAPITYDARWTHVAGRFSLQELSRILEEPTGLGQTGEIYLVNREGVAFPQGQQLSSSTIEATIYGKESAGLYENYSHVPVIGVYRWLPLLDVAFFVEESQEEAFAGNDAVAAAVVFATLVVALVTILIAAIVIGQITRPVRLLTESALHIAAGDLSQRVAITSRDEIGILANVFNRMVSELETLYTDLEEKVAKRTQLLQRANYLIQRRAIQMQASLEVGQVVTSILDPDQLLEKVVRVVKDQFVYSYVVVYTVDDEDNDCLVQRACAGQPNHFHKQRVPANLPGPLGKAFREGEATVENHAVPVTVGPPTTYIRSEVALPLSLGGRTLGVLAVQTTGEEGFDKDEVFILQNVANQITIALENARTYDMERQAAQRLRELDRSKRRFLANMSHELRTPLTNIIGFSWLMLNGKNKLTEQEQKDLQVIYHNGQHLLGLVNDLLDVSQIEAGLMELQFRQVDLVELIHSVMATASALVRGRAIALKEEIAPDLPTVPADPVRIRQVLLRLLANAAKFTAEGEICMQAWYDAERVYVSVSDTGIGIFPQDQERIFERFEQGALENGSRPNGAGLGLALSKGFVEMHGGEIWVSSEVGKGSTFTFTLPLAVAERD
ncbi:MAG: GAF domain-containing protein [Anaerolineae bacterium]|nr:GAF domain-containing protein [Anaerolineae bacterium]